MKRLVIFSIVLFPGCAKISIDREFSKLKQQTIDRAEKPISITTAYTENLSTLDTSYDLNKGLSREEAIRFALINNPELRADFDNLGIAKADLIQAGLYTNPSINSVFRFPTKSPGPGTAQTNIESTASFRLSDLWQVPLTKRVSEDLLEIISLRILDTIISLIAETKIAYDTCLMAQLITINTKQLLDTQKELRDEIYYRQLYGYTDDLDKNNADSQLAITEALFLNAQAQEQSAFIHLKKLLGITPSKEPIFLTSAFDDIIKIPSHLILEEAALRQRPEIQIALMKIQQYQDTVSLERAKIFKQVDVGVSYKQDFDKPFRGWGPYVNFEIPLFDTNYAQIARAEFLYDQAQKELTALKIKTKKEIADPYSAIQFLEKEVVRYKNYIIPADQKAINFAYTYTQIMQLTAVTVYQAKIKLYEDAISLTNHIYHLRKEIALLEKAIGEKIEHFSINC